MRAAARYAWLRAATRDQTDARIAMALIEGTSYRDTRVRQPAPAPPAPETHRVAPNETAREIAVRYRIPADRIAAANPQVDDLRNLGGGETLDIPPPADDAPEPLVYTVTQDESVAEIAQRHGTTEQALQQANGLAAEEQVPGGEQLLIPTDAGSPAAPVARYGSDTGPIDDALASYASAQRQLELVGSQPFALEGVRLAREGLQTAVGNSLETEAARTLYPPGSSLGYTNIAQVADGLVARYADDPAAQAAVREAATEVGLDLEVESFRTTVLSASDPGRTPALLDAALEVASPEAQARLLADPQVQAQLDAATDAIAPPLAEEDYANANSFQGYTLSALERFDAATADADPRILAALTDRVFDRIDTARQAYADVASDGDLTDIESLGTEGLDLLLGLSERLPGTPGGDPAIARMGEFVAGHYSGLGFTLDYHDSFSDSVRDGGGAELFIATAAALRETGDVASADALLTQTADDVRAFAEGPLAESVDDYLEHTAQLSFMIRDYGPDAPPEVLETAIQNYIDGQGADWQTRLETLEAEVAGRGADLLAQMAAFDAVPPELRAQLGVDETLTELAGSDAVAVAINTAAGRHPDRLADVDLPAAMHVLDALDLATGDGMDLLNAVANAHVQTRVLPQLGQIDPNDPASVARARAAIDTLRSNGFAEAWGISSAQLDEVVTALQDTVPTEGTTQAQTRTALERYNTRLGEIDAFDQYSPLGQSFRGLGLAVSVAGLAQSAPDFVNDPSFEGGVQLLADSVGLAADIGELGQGLGWLPDSNPLSRLGASSAAGKLLGGIGLVFGTVGVLQSASEGDWSQAGLGAAAVGGTALALFGTASWAGPVGWAVAGLATAGSLGLNHYRRVQESNQFHNDESAAFLEDLGFSPETAETLTDQSGEGISPVPLLMEYGRIRGLDAEGTRAWLESLQANGQLDDLRDHVHHVLDEIDGDLSRFTATSEADEAATAMLEEGWTLNVPSAAALDGWIAHEFGADALPSEVSYESASRGDNSVTWTVDAEGRPVYAEATLGEVFSNLPRSSAETTAQGDARERGVDGDAGGHVVGHRFVGDQGLRNLFPQDGQFNNSAYRTLENEWADWTRNGMEVRLEVSLSPQGQDRPDEVAVSYEVVDPDSGEVIYDNNVLFQNESGQTFDRIRLADMPRYYG